MLFSFFTYPTNGKSLKFDVCVHVYVNVCVYVSLQMYYLRSPTLIFIAKDSLDQESQTSAVWCPLPSHKGWIL